MAMTAQDIIFSFLQLCAIASCTFGVYWIYGFSSSIISLTFYGLWFILAIGSNLAGFVSTMLFNFSSDEEMDLAHSLLRFHMLAAWFCVTLAYQAFVANTWMVYTGSTYALLHSLLTLIPLTTWYLHKNKITILSTQVLTAIGSISHVYISYLAGNLYGIIGGVIMGLNIISLSVPGRHSFLGISSRETFILGLGCASYIFSKQVEEMAKHPVLVTKFY